MSISKQDLTAPRTPSDIERKYLFEKQFAEIMGIATGARTTAKEAAAQAARAEAELSFRLVEIEDEDGNEKIISRLTASVDEMQISGNRLVVESDNFVLDADGTIIATSGLLSGLQVNDCRIDQCTIDDCTINETCIIKGTLAAKQIHTGEIGCGISYDEYKDEYDPIHDWESYTMYAGGARIYVSSELGGTVSLDAGGTSISVYDGGVEIRSLYGARINGDAIVTESGLTEIKSRLAALEKAQNG